MINLGGGFYYFSIFFFLRIFVIHSATSDIQDRVIFGHFYVLDSIITTKGDNHRLKINFFDSYGRHFLNLGHKNLERKLRNLTVTADIHRNTKQYQKGTDINCAHLSIYFLLMRARGHSLKVIQQKKFGKNRFYWKFVTFLINDLLPPNSLSRTVTHE